MHAQTYNIIINICAQVSISMNTHDIKYIVVANVETINDKEQKKKYSKTTTVISQANSDCDTIYVIVLHDNIGKATCEALATLKE